MACNCDNCNCSGSENIVQIIGQKGETGAAGAVPTIQAGTTTTLDPGENADVEMTNPSTNVYQYNFSIPAGADGTNGTNGTNGWSPILAVVSDGERRVLQIVSWTGGTGSPPSSTNQFIGAVGIVSTAAAAVDVRGAIGATPNGAVPIGGSVEYGGITDPDANWMIEDGRAVSRATYATLFSAISTRFGVGDGSTTFNIPNSTGRIAIGLTAAVTGLNTVGKVGGATTAIIAASNLPIASPWGVADPGHDHSQTASQAAGGPSFGVDATPSRNGQGALYLNTSSDATGITLASNSGGGQGMSILNPFIVKYKIIRVL